MKSIPTLITGSWKCHVLITILPTLLGLWPCSYAAAQNQLQELAPDFDGENDHVEVPHDDRLNLTTFTIELWFRADQNGDGYRVLTTLQGNNWRDRNWWLTLQKEGRIMLKPSRLTTSEAYDDHNWHHVTAVIDSDQGNARLYVDGQLKTNGDVNNPDTPEGPMIIGAEAVKFGEKLKRHFNGAISEVRLWNDVRTASEIQNHMYRSLTGNEQGLVGYWPLKSNNTGNDVSGNGIHGKMVGDPQPALLLPFEKNLTGDRSVTLSDTVTIGPVMLRNPRGNVSFQWYHDDEPIDGATGQTLTRSKITGEQLGTYYVMVNDARDLTPVRSKRMTLTLDKQEYFTKNLPDEKVVRTGKSVTLGPVRLSNPKGEVSYQWYADGDPINGATEKTLTIEEVSEDHFGAYHVEVEDKRQTSVTSNRMYVGTKRVITARELGDVTKDTPPDDVYGTFNRFCKAHFGAEKEPLVYQKFGKKLTFREEGYWKHVSQNSAVIAWETNLPARSAVAYGSSKDLSNQSSLTERPFYNHVHYLADLRPGTTYYFRLLTKDERGNTVKGPINRFTTAPRNDVIPLPGNRNGPPYELAKKNATYVLTEDLTADGTAIQVKAPGITLDLGGHTVVYHNNQRPEGTPANGIKNLRNNDVTLLNGTVREGSSSGTKHNPIYMLSSNNIRIAGVTVDYQSPQTSGIRLRYCGGEMTVHHTVFLDRGTRILDRHGSAVRSLLLQGVDSKKLHWHHNLVKRTRQMGLPGGYPSEHNEIYVDSWSVNSFAQHVGNGAEVRNNRIFGTGVNPFGVGWSDQNYVVQDNLIHFQGIDTGDHRYKEDWGEQDALGGFRITDYQDGKTKRTNLLYENNLLLINARGGSQARGTQFWSSPNQSNVRLTGGTIKVEADDPETKRVGAVVTHGERDPNNQPVVYRDATLKSNRAIIRFGDKYGRGWNHHFRRCKLRRTGNDEQFHTFVFDGEYTGQDHVLLDCDFGEGTAWDDVLWYRTGTNSHYTVKWTLTLRTPPNATVKITNAQGETVVNDSTGTDGQLKVPLTQGIVGRPDDEDWRTPSTNTDIIHRTPHRVQVMHQDQTVKKTIRMTEPKTLDLR